MLLFFKCLQIARLLFYNLITRKINKIGEINNIASMMKQAQQMQKKLQEAQTELANTEFTAVSGNGAVTAICDGQGKFKALKLTKAALNPENPDSVDDDTLEMLEDLIATAMKQATEQASTAMEAKMKSLTGGIHIPGLF